VKHNVFRDGHVHVCAQMCSTCVFRPGNVMSLEAGKLREMVDGAITNETAIICHQTIPEAGGEEQAVCRGFFDRYRTAALMLAVELAVIREVPIAQQDVHDEAGSTV
jgi:hypothetical protein